MQSSKTKKSTLILCVKALTWNKDSHSLFDYESTKVQASNFYFSLNPNKPITLYRKRQASSCISSDSVGKIDPQEYQLLTQFQIKSYPDNNKVKLEFISGTEQKIKKENNNEKLKTEESNSSISAKEEDTYIIVRKNAESISSVDECKGYPLQVGQSIKLGRVEYYVSEISIDGSIKIASPNPKSRKYFSNATMQYKKSDYDVRQGQEKNACKICLDDTETKQNFLFRPCKCAGSCGTVHLECLLHWIKIKVKKDVVGGTVHYNFEKFECEVCKSELPMVIDIQGDKCELLPITKPKGNYMILQAACQKSKSVMMIQNIAQEGIKLGRGHECEIRITDISVSRNHALIKFVNNNFVVFDNKSKFGTLVRYDNMSLEIGKSGRGVQIGRTTLSFEIKKREDVRQE